MNSLRLLCAITAILCAFAFACAFWSFAQCSEQILRIGEEIATEMKEWRKMEREFNEMVEREKQRRKNRGKMDGEENEGNGGGSGAEEGLVGKGRKRREEGVQKPICECQIGRKAQQRCTSGPPGPPGKALVG